MFLLDYFKVHQDFAVGQFQLVDLLLEQRVFVSVYQLVQLRYLVLQRDELQA